MKLYPRFHPTLTRRVCRRRPRRRSCHRGELPGAVPRAGALSFVCLAATSDWGSLTEPCAGAGGRGDAVHRRGEVPGALPCAGAAGGRAGGLLGAAHLPGGAAAAGRHQRPGRPAARLAAAGSTGALLGAHHPFVAPVRKGGPHPLGSVFGAHYMSGCAAAAGCY